MSIDIQTVTKIAKLSRIGVEESDKAHFAEQLNAIIGWVEQLQEVNTDAVEAMSSVSDATLPQRADEITDGEQSEAVLANAPISEYGCFAVPKVIE